MALDSVNAVSHAAHRLSYSPNDCHPWNRMAWPEPVTTASVWLDLPSQTMSSTTGACQACGGGGVVPQSLVEITCISKTIPSPWQSGDGFLIGDWDDEQEGVLPNASASSGPFWPLGGVRVWPSV